MRVEWIRDTGVNAKKKCSMKTSQWDDRCHELQRDLIAGLPTERLLHLEIECAAAAKKAANGMIVTFGVMVALLMGILALRGAAGFLFFLRWGLVLMAWVWGVLLLSKGKGGLWAIRFSNGANRDFSLPDWMNGRDDPHQLRAWRENAGTVHAETFVRKPINVAGWREMLKAILLMIGAAVFYGFFFKGALDLLTFGAVVLFWMSRIYERFGEFDPDKFGSGYSEIVSTLDARGAEHGDRRRR